MKIVTNRVIPFKGFQAVNLFGIYFVRRDALPDLAAESHKFQRMLRHEKIHTRQMRELGYLPFYLWYLVEWIIRFVLYRSPRKAYLRISFEQEAYRQEDDPLYLTQRKPYAFAQYYCRPSSSTR